jgi:hypothetical protein
MSLAIMVRGKTGNCLGVTEKQGTLSQSTQRPQSFKPISPGFLGELGAFARKNVAFLRAFVVNVAV